MPGDCWVAISSPRAPQTSEVYSGSAHVLQCINNCTSCVHACQDSVYSCPYQWKIGPCLPYRGMFFNRFVVAEGRGVAADWSRNQLYVSDFRPNFKHPSWTITSNTHDAGRLYRLFTVGDKCYGTFYMEDSNEQEQTIASYNVDKNKWTTVTEIPPNSALQWYGITSDKDRIYIVGGWDSSRTGLDTVLIYDVGTGLLCGKTKMLSKRRSCSCAIVDKTLYVAGGFYGSNGLNTVEALSLVDYSCRTVVSTETYRCSMAALCGQLVVTGGTTDSGDYSTCSNMVAVYDSPLGGWIRLGPMKNKRLFHGMSTFDDDDNNALFVLGGDDCVNGFVT